MAFDFLNGLTDDEKRELQAHLAFSLQARPASYSDSELALWEALAEVCKVSNARPALDAVVKSIGRKAYADKAAAVAALLKKAVLPATRRPLVNALRLIMLQSLCASLKARGLPVSPRSLLSNISMLADAVDAQFPGYLEAGLMLRIATRPATAT